MKESRNGIKIIGIDHGYGNIKTACTVTPTGITAYSTEPTFGGNILFYDGMNYRIGEGHKAFIADKSTDNDFYLFTLAAVARELSQQGISKADVHIAVGLPLTWVKTQREDFRSYLTRNEEVSFVFKDKPYRIMNSSHILPSGSVPLHPIPPQRQQAIFQTLLVRRVGSLIMITTLRGQIIDKNNLPAF